MSNATSDGPNHGGEERRDRQVAAQGESRSVYRTSLKRRQACYEQAVRTAIANQFPLGPEDRQTLRRLQQALKLPNDVTRSIDRRVSALAAEEEGRYQALLQQYEDELQRLLETGPLSDADRQRLTQKRSQWQIAPQDADVIERQVRARYPDPAATSDEMAATQLEPVAASPAVAGRVGAIQVWHPEVVPHQLELPEESPEGDRPASYERLEALLQATQWQAADQETFRCMLHACDRTEDGWLDRAAVEAINPASLRAIDQLWHRYSDGQFSFKTQRDMAQAMAQQQQQPTCDPLQFGLRVGWLLWDRPFLGFKYYRQLTFDRTAPEGHLPAQWFWTIPLQQALKCGGLTAGRGGCAKDGGLLAALHGVLDQVYSP